MLDGVFINLSRSDARRAQMEVQLADCHSSDFIKRFAATDGSVEGPFENSALNGAWACRRSHENVINFASNLSATVVLEDDVELSGSFSTFINEAVVSSFVESNENCDILFLECCPYSAQVPFLLSLAEKQMSGRTREDLLEGDRYIPFGLNIVDAKGIYAYSTASYIVTPKGKSTLRRLFQDNPSPATAIDMLYRDWLAAGVIEAKITVPFLATPRFVIPSTIDYDCSDTVVVDAREQELSNLIRRLLFAGDPGLDLEQISRNIAAKQNSSAEYKLGMQLYEALRPNC